ncbi:YugN family protein [Cohnella suwonensis]|uniref:YugN family protein n=1 Tax=Cohnella suwonensis TaxID=696072 RepID=A0ABW0LS05_9BACL
MHTLSSSLTSQVGDYLESKEALQEHGFTLGGNWDFDHGSFDCALDGANKVWLRLPFDVTVGNLDSEAPRSGTRIQFGNPYVLKHIYNEGLDPEMHTRSMGPLLDQFSDPVDPDAEIESHWIEKAKSKLNEAETLYPR